MASVSMAEVDFMVGRRSARRVFFKSPRIGGSGPHWREKIESLAFCSRFTRTTRTRTRTNSHSLAPPRNHSHPLATTRTHSQPTRTFWCRSKLNSHSHPLALARTHSQSLARNHSHPLAITRTCSRPSHYHSHITRIFLSLKSRLKREARFLQTKRVDTVLGCD
eukprot:scaffold165735_cov36-Cyclotella_meneghiniana.AAC.1